jgi:hypothetical protein
MGVEEGLSDYLQSVQPPQRGEVEERVEGIFQALALPWTRDRENWQIDSDVGLVMAGLDEDKDILTFFQVLGPWDSSKPKKQADLMQALLRMNSGSSGACYAIFGDAAQNDERLMIVARIAAKSIDKEEVALALTSLFEMSRVFD